MTEKGCDVTKAKGQVHYESYLFQGMTYTLYSSLIEKNVLVYRMIKLHTLE